MRDRTFPIRRLRMIAARLGNPADRMTSWVGSLGQRDVRERDDPDRSLRPLATGHPPPLDVGYVMRDLLDLIIRKTIFHVGAHDLADRGLRSLAGGARTDRESRRRCPSA